MTALPPSWPGWVVPGRRRSRTQTALAAAAAVSVLLHLAAFSVRLSTGGGLSPPLHVAPPLAVRIITLSQLVKTPAPSEAIDTVLPEPVQRTGPEQASAELRRARGESSRASARTESAVVAVPRETPMSTPPVPMAPPAAALEAPASRSPAATQAAAPAGYTNAAGLNPPPRPLDDITPDFPEAAGTRGGSVVLRLFINEAGGVDKIEVVRSSPPGLFEAAALAAFGSARFSPGFLAGVPVRSQVMYEVEFARQARDSAASGRTY